MKKLLIIIFLLAAQQFKSATGSEVFSTPFFPLTASLAIQQALILSAAYLGKKAIRIPANIKTLTSEDYKYCYEIISRYKLLDISNSLKFFKATSDDTDYYALAHGDSIIFQKAYFNSPGFYKEFTLLHEIGHILYHKKLPSTYIKKVLISMLISHLILKKIFPNKLTVPQFYIIFLIHTINHIFLARDEQVKNETNADKYSLTKLKYTDPQDYIKLKVEFEHRLKQLNEKYKFLPNIDFIKRLAWHFHSPYLFPQDALNIIDKKIQEHAEEQANIKDIKSLLVTLKF